MDIVSRGLRSRKKGRDKILKLQATSYKLQATSIPGGVA